jgi:SAM-dependent methyltransferase/tetratricopeptide (TPR) repeat protein
MKPARRPKPTSDDFLKQGRDAFLAGRVYLAAEAFTKALKIDPRNPAVLFNLASAKERIGEIDEAARLLTQALRSRPWFEPAQRLALLAGRYRIEGAGELDPHGLLAAFAFDRVDRQPIAAAAIAHLRARSPLGDAAEKAKAGDAEEAARGLVLRRTDKALSHPLLLAALAASPNRDPDFERLLTAVRRVLLLEVPADRFEDKALTGFTIALIRQCLVNEYIFATGPGERQRLGEAPVDLASLLAGAPDQSRQLMLHLLYEPPGRLIGKALTAAECHAIRPRALGEVLMSWLEEDDLQTIFATDIPVIGAIEDSTSKKVASQYEAHPYPRWDSLHTPREGSARPMLERFFAPETLGFLDRPFKVLIAGAGTGRHALSAAIRYGPSADVLAVDLSRRSLAYAKAKAERFEVKNIRFAQADLQNMSAGDGPFDIVEAVGVLHHMAEPFNGWKTLAGLLRPGGLMLTGLYSAVARKNIAALRSESGFPGPEIDDEMTRTYRQSLMNREDEEAARLLSSHDFYTLSEFRDLILHEQERPVFLSEIEAFIDQNGLLFRGFQLPGPIVEAFVKTFPEDRWPGTFTNWSAFEEAHPRIFDAMYRLWCEKAP